MGIVNKAGKLIKGYNKCEETIKKSKVYMLILSENSSENTKNKFKKYCQLKNIICIEGYTSEELGETIGIPEINVLCVTDRNMSERLLALHNILK
jgi:ribosomal protein L7Ae-like RNA K-turn-binding protein